MSSMKVSSNVKQAQVEAVITRADGTKVNLGSVAYYHRNPVIRWIHNTWITIKRMWLRT